MPRLKFVIILNYEANQLQLVTCPWSLQVLMRFCLHQISSVNVTQWLNYLFVFDRLENGVYIVQCQDSLPKVLYNGFLFIHMSIHESCQKLVNGMNERVNVLFVFHNPELCPELIFVPPNFAKYKKASKQTRFFLCYFLPLFSRKEIILLNIDFFTW
jgi:hypothetical protein